MVLVLVLVQGLFTEGGGGAVGPYSMLNITGTYKGELCSLSPLPFGGSSLPPSEPICLPKLQCSNSLCIAFCERNYKLHVLIENNVNLRAFIP